VTFRPLVSYAGRLLGFEHESAEDHIALHHARGRLYEAPLIDHMRTLPEIRGRWMLDVGAHVGNHAAAMLAGGEVAGVIACEPTERYRALCAVLRSVDPLGSRWNAMRVAVGDGEVVELVPPPPGNSGMARVRVAEAGVVTMRVDEMAKELDVGLVKVDVEGHERHVILGALATLRRCRPALVVEGARDMLDALLEALGYAWDSTWCATPTHVYRVTA
jgi:FkbM family methyltransferase